MRLPFGVKNRDGSRGWCGQGSKRPAVAGAATAGNRFARTTNTARRGCSLRGTFGGLKEEAQSEPDTRALKKLLKRVVVCELSRRVSALLASSSFPLRRSEDQLSGAGLPEPRKVFPSQTVIGHRETDADDSSVAGCSGEAMSSCISGTRPHGNGETGNSHVGQVQEVRLTQNPVPSFCKRNDAVCAGAHSRDCNLELEPRDCVSVGAVEKQPFTSGAEAASAAREAETETKGTEHCLNSRALQLAETAGRLISDDGSGAIPGCEAASRAKVDGHNADSATLPLIKSEAPEEAGVHGPQVLCSVTETPGPFSKGSKRATARGVGCKGKQKSGRKTCSTGVSPVQPEQAELAARVCLEPADPQKKGFLADSRSSPSRLKADPIKNEQRVASAVTDPPGEAQTPGTARNPRGVPQGSTSSCACAGCCSGESRAVCCGCPEHSAGLSCGAPLPDAGTTRFTETASNNTTKRNQNWPEATQLESALLETALTRTVQSKTAKTEAEASGTDEPKTRGLGPTEAEGSRPAETEGLGSTGSGVGSRSVSPQRGAKKPVAQGHGTGEPETALQSPAGTRVGVPTQLGSVVGEPRIAAAPESSVARPDVTQPKPARTEASGSVCPAKLGAEGLVAREADTTGQETACLVPETTSAKSEVRYTARRRTKARRTLRKTATNNSAENSAEADAIRGAEGETPVTTTAETRVTDCAEPVQMERNPFVGRPGDCSESAGNNEAHPPAAKESKSKRRRAKRVAGTPKNEVVDAVSGGIAGQPATQKEAPPDEAKTRARLQHPPAESAASLPLPAVAWVLLFENLRPDFLKNDTLAKPGARCGIEARLLLRAWLCLRTVSCRLLQLWWESLDDVAACYFCVRMSVFPQPNTINDARWQVLHPRSAYSFIGLFVAGQKCAKNHSEALLRVKTSTLRLVRLLHAKDDPRTPLSRTGGWSAETWTSLLKDMHSDMPPSELVDAVLFRARTRLLVVLVDCLHSENALWQRHSAAQPAFLPNFMQVSSNENFLSCNSHVDAQNNPLLHSLSLRLTQSLEEDSSNEDVAPSSSECEKPSSKNALRKAQRGVSGKAQRPTSSSAASAAPSTTERCGQPAVCAQYAFEDMLQTRSGRSTLKLTFEDDGDALKSWRNICRVFGDEDTVRQCFDHQKRGSVYGRYFPSPTPVQKGALQTKPASLDLEGAKKPRVLFKHLPKKDDAFRAKKAPSSASLLFSASSGVLVSHQESSSEIVEGTIARTYSDTYIRTTRQVLNAYMISLYMRYADTCEPFCGVLNSLYEAWLGLFHFYDTAWVWMDRVLCADKKVFCFFVDATLRACRLHCDGAPPDTGPIPGSPFYRNHSRCIVSTPSASRADGCACFFDAACERHSVGIKYSLLTLLEDIVQRFPDNAASYDRESLDACGKRVGLLEHPLLELVWERIVLRFVEPENANAGYSAFARRCADVFHFLVREARHASPELTEEEAARRVVCMCRADPWLSVTFPHLLGWSVRASLRTVREACDAVEKCNNAAKRAQKAHDARLAVAKQMCDFWRPLQEGPLCTLFPALKAPDVLVWLGDFARVALCVLVLVANRWDRCSGLFNINYKLFGANLIRDVCRSVSLLHGSPNLDLLQLGCVFRAEACGVDCSFLNAQSRLELLQKLLAQLPRCSGLLVDCVTNGAFHPLLSEFDERSFEWVLRGITAYTYFADTTQRDALLSQVTSSPWLCGMRTHIFRMRWNLARFIHEFAQTLPATDYRDSARLRSFDFDFFCSSELLRIFSTDFVLGTKWEPMEWRNQQSRCA